MPWIQTGATHYYSYLGLSDKSRAIKELVASYVVWLGSLKELGLKTCLGLVYCCSQDGHRAQVPHHPVET